MIMFVIIGVVAIVLWTLCNLIHAHMWSVGQMRAHLRNQSGFARVLSIICYTPAWFLKALKAFIFATVK